MISKEENIRLSKLLSYALRHKPHHLGIVLDENGWTDVQILLSRFSEREETINLETLKHIVATNSKNRFSFNSDFSMIRASQGHSIDVDLDYAQQQPPEFLFHGTAQRFLESILLIGLKKMSRQHVHLSDDIETAQTVGRRHGIPVVLKINSLKMYSANHFFYLSDNGVWLTESVPAEFISVEEKT